MKIYIIIITNILDLKWHYYKSRDIIDNESHKNYDLHRILSDVIHNLFNKECIWIINNELNVMFLIVTIIRKEPNLIK